MGRRKTPAPFYVFIDDVNAEKFVPYDVMPYFIREYDAITKTKRPKTFNEFRSWVEGKALSQFWARCQYEVVLTPWVSRTEPKKVDVYWQLKPNLGLLTRLIMGNLGIKEVKEDEH